MKRPKTKMSTVSSGNSDTISPKDFASGTPEDVIEQLRKMNLLDLADVVENMHWTGAKAIMYKTVLRLVNAAEYQVLEEYLRSETGEGIVRKDFLIPERTFCINGPIRFCDNYHYIYQESASKLADILSAEGNTGIYGLYASRFSGKTTFLLQLIPFLVHWKLEVACIFSCRRFKHRTIMELGQKAMTSISKSSFSTDLARTRACEWLAMKETTRPENFLSFLCDGAFQGKKLVILWDDFDFMSGDPSIIASVSSMLADLQDGLFIGDYLALRSIVLVGTYYSAFRPFGIVPRKIFGPDFIKISPEYLLQKSLEHENCCYNQKREFKMDFTRRPTISSSLALSERTDGHAGIIGIMCHVFESNSCLELNAESLVKHYDDVVEAIQRHPVFHGMMEALEECGDSSKQLLLELCSTNNLAHDTGSVEQENLLKIGLAKICPHDNRSIAISSEFFRIMAWKRLWSKNASKPMSLDSFSFRVEKNEIVCELLGQIRPEIIANSTRKDVPLIRYSTAVAEVIYRVHKQSRFTVIPVDNFHALLIYDKTAPFFHGLAISFSFRDSYESFEQNLDALQKTLGFSIKTYAIIKVSPQPDSRAVDNSNSYIVNNPMHILYHDYGYKNAKVWYDRDHVILKEGQCIPYKRRSPA